MRRPALFCFFFILLTGSPTPLHAQPKKTTEITEVSGKGIEYWIKEMGAKDPSRREIAIRAVLAFGPDRAYQGIPVLLEQLKKHGNLTPVDLSVRVHGAIAVGEILGGSKAPERKHVKEAVLILKRYLGDSQAIMRYRAAQALGRLGTDAKEAIPDLIGLVKYTETYEVRQAAAGALGLVAQDENKGPALPVLNALYLALGDAAVQVRLTAIQALSTLGGPADPNLRLGLMKALDGVAYQDAEPAVQIWGHMAVMSISRTVYKDRVEIISKFLTHAEVSPRIQASQALGTMGKDAKAYVPNLIKNLADEDANVVFWSIWALAKMEQSAAGAVPALERLSVSSNQSETIKLAARDAVEQINGQKKKN